MPTQLTYVLLLLALLGPSLSGSVHVIPLPATSSPSSFLAWDRISQHFLIGSPRLSSVSDAAILQNLTALSSPVTAVAVDDIHRRLIAASSSPASVSAFDLRSPIPHSLLFSSPLPDPAVSVTSSAIDPSTGTAFIATSAGDILTVDLNGKISRLAHVSGQIGGLAHVNRGYLLVVLKDKGEIFKVDAEDGAAKKVLISLDEEAKAIAMKNDGTAIAMKSDGTAVVAVGRAARWLKSGDGWAEAAVYDEFRVGEGERVKGVAVREGKRAYVLVVKEGEGEGQNGEWRIEEVEWEKEGKGEMVWTMVLIGFGLAYFMYWRFQMGKLVTSVNKKRA